VPLLTYFHGEFSSADASALTEPNSRFTLYQDGTTTSITLAATDKVVITDIDIRVGITGRTVQVYDGANNTVDAGETIHAGTYAASTGHNRVSATPHSCQLGSYPKVKTSGAGQVDLNIRGYVLSQLSTPA